MWLLLEPVLDGLEVAVSSVDIFVEFFSDVDLEFGAGLDQKRHGVPARIFGIRQGSIKPHKK